MVGTVSGAAAVQFEQQDFGPTVHLVGPKGEGFAYRVSGHAGMGTMILYPAFPGIDVVISSFSTQSCFSEYRSSVPLMGIDYCLEGRIEWELDNGNCLYMQKGDVRVSSKCSQVGSFGFPLTRYCGITLGVRPEMVDEETAALLGRFGIRPQWLLDITQHGDKPLIRQADQSLAQLFQGLKDICERDCRGHLQIKVMELLYVSQTAQIDQYERRDCFSKKQVEIVKAIAAFITENLEKNYTVQQLSQRFGIPPTSLKLCFKGVFGMPVGRYLRQYRMDTAAQMLRDGGHSVAAVAGAMGYDNQSKFAAAFKSVMGASPKQYQRISTSME